MCAANCVVHPVQRNTRMGEIFFAGTVCQNEDIFYLQNLFDHSTMGTISINSIICIMICWVYLRLHITHAFNLKSFSILFEGKA